ncbi:hypothetical protein PJM50_30770, partial [Mycobacterium kansasii]
ENLAFDGAGTVYLSRQDVVTGEGGLLAGAAPGGAPVPFALRGEPVNGLWFDGASGRLWASTAPTATTRLYAIDPA